MLLKDKSSGKCYYFVYLVNTYYSVMVRIGCVAPCMLGHLHVGMTSIQNGGYFWLKTNYLVYLCCLEFLSGFNDPSFFLGRKRFRGVH